MVQSLPVGTYLPIYAMKKAEMCLCKIPTRNKNKKNWIITDDGVPACFATEFFHGAKSCTNLTQFFHVKKIRINCDVALFVDILQFCKVATFFTFCVSKRALLSPVPLGNYQPSYVKVVKNERKQTLYQVATVIQLQNLKRLRFNHVILLK